jgi:hypothetical protein
MIILDSTSKSLVAVLAGAVAANQPIFTVGFANTDGTAFTETSADGTLNSTTEVELVAAPAASNRRIIKWVTIYNADTAAITVSVSLKNGANVRIIRKKILAAGDSLLLGINEPLAASSLGLGSADGPTFDHLHITNAINALTLAAAAVGFTLAGGTSSKTLTVSGNTEIGQVWTTPTFAAGDFTATGSMTWTVEAGDVATFRYMILGKTMFFLISINSTTVGGTPSYGLKIKIPGAFSAAKSFTVPVYVNDNGSEKIGKAWVGTGDTIFYFTIGPAAANWTASTNLTGVEAMFVFEVI